MFSSSPLNLCWRICLLLIFFGQFREQQYSSQIARLRKWKEGFTKCKFYQNQGVVDILDGNPSPNIPFNKTTPQGKGYKNPSIASFFCFLNLKIWVQSSSLPLISIEAKGGRLMGLFLYFVVFGTTGSSIFQTTNWIKFSGDSTMVKLVLCQLQNLA